MTQLKTKFLSNNAVTYAKVQQALASTLIGNPTGSTANIEEITLGSGLSFSGTVLNSTASLSPSNIQSSTGTGQTYTNSSNRNQICSPSSARTDTMPTTSILAGDTWTIVNTSTTAANIITLHSSGSNTIDYVLANGIVILVALVNSPTTAANWNVINANSSWVSYTPNLGAGWGTVTSLSAFMRRERKQMYVKFAFVTGSVTASDGTLDFLSFNIDTNFSTINTTTSSPSEVVGFANGGKNTSYHQGSMVASTSTSTSQVYITQPFLNSSNITPNSGVNSTFGNTEVITGHFEIPISGWN